jgi:hypothetical protein
LEIVREHRASDLPDRWDTLADEYFQTREFLDHTEEHNPCKQRYYLLYMDDALQAGMVVYTLRLDLLTYLSIPSPFRMNIIGIPCSVSASGIIGSHADASLFFGHVRKLEKGFLLALNLDSVPAIHGYVMGRTLPTIVVEGRFRSWEHYMESLRSHYRRRMIRLAHPFSSIRKEQGDCSGFSETMYSQYLDVLKRSKGKLETLTPGFIRNLPPGFHLTAYYHREKLIGWFISAVFRGKYYFFLGGIDYELNEQFNTYFNLLAGVLRRGIEKDTSVIDLGQTAEIPKLRLGGELNEKTMLGTHSNRIVRKLLAAGKGLLEYSTVVKEPRVFNRR